MKKYSFQQQQSFSYKQSKIRHIYRKKKYIQSKTIEIAIYKKKEEKGNIFRRISSMVKQRRCHCCGGDNSGVQWKSWKLIEKFFSLLLPFASRLALITTPPPLLHARIITHRCQNNLIICRADDRSCILLVKNVSPSPISPPFYSHCEPKLAEHFDISNEIFPPRNVDNFVRLGTGCRVKFLFGIRRNILAKYLFRDTRVCRFYISFFCSFFLSFFYWIDGVFLE